MRILSLDFMLFKFCFSLRLSLRFLKYVLLVDRFIVNSIFRSFLFAFRFSRGTLSRLFDVCILMIWILLVRTLRVFLTVFWNFF